MYCIVTVMRFAIILIKFYVCRPMYVWLTLGPTEPFTKTCPKPNVTRSGLSPPWLMCQLSTEFYENRLSSFCVVLLINKQTNKQTKQLTNKRRWKHNLLGRVTFSFVDCIFEYLVDKLVRCPSVRPSVSLSSLSLFSNSKNYHRVVFVCYFKIALHFCVSPR